jgi:UDP-glucose 4-epimerase
MGIFAASLKQIEACNDNHEEASKIIIDGAFNSRLAAEENEFKSACFISSDKSRAATTLYGAMKYVAGEGFIAGTSKVNLTTIIYGNVTNSTGSIIPLIWDSINSNRTLQLYGDNMTRFLLDVIDAIELVLKSPEYSGVNLIPVAKSFRVKDLFEIYHDEFGLEYEVTIPRTGEKIHEIMASSEEIRRMTFDDKNELYILHPKRDINELTFTNDEYSSRDTCLSKDELYKYLKNKNFYR